MEIPKVIKNIVKKIEENDFEAYLVGGCVRDFVIGKKPKDWDLTTNAAPEKLEEIFPDSFLENDYGTVTVLTKEEDPTLKQVEITPYRIEKDYKDKRHPEDVKFTNNLKEDLARRDFTINAMALKVEEDNYSIVDPYEGQKDLEKRVIRAVRDPQERFNEDALRMMRAVRFATRFDFIIEPETKKAIQDHAASLKDISKERIRDEFIKIINQKKAAAGIRLLRKTKLLSYVIPEFKETYGVAQNKHHIYNVYEHLVRSLEYAARQGFNEEVRLAALFHDIGKPRTKEGQGEAATFYNHEIVSADMTREIMKRLKFSKDKIKKVVKLVRYHLFYYNVDEVGESSVRKLLRGVGEENTRDLVKLRMADRIGSGVPKARPYKLRHLQYMMEKVSRDPISTKKLAVDGNEVMSILDIEPGPKVGQILLILLGEVLEDPAKNDASFLKERVQEISKMNDEEIKKKARITNEEINRIEKKLDEMTKEKYWVQ